MDRLSIILWTRTAALSTLESRPLSYKLRLWQFPNKAFTVISMSNGHEVLYSSMLMWACARLFFDALDPFAQIYELLVCIKYS